MKILHAAESIKGGVATVMRTLALAQSDEATVRCLVPAGHAREMAPFRNLLTFNHKSQKVASWLSFCWNFTKAVVLFRPHVVHLHSMSAGVMGRILLVLLWPLVRPRVVYTPHAWAFLIEGSPHRKRIYAAIEKALYPLADAIVCVSKFEAAEAKRFGLPSHKTTVVYNGTPVITAREIPNPYNTSKLNLLFVGRLDFQKGFDVMLDAMERLQKNPEAAHIHLTVVGEGASKAQRPTRPNITYMGWLNPEKVIPFFAHANVLVVPSRWEGFGLVVAEALSYGTPVLASNVSSLPEVVENGKSGLLFTPCDSQELAEILAKTTREEWRRMGQNAEALHNKAFTVEKMVAQTAKVYGA